MQEEIMRRHITDEMWIALKQDTIRPEEFMEILEHTCDCTWCAERMAETLGQEENKDADLVPVPPSYLAEEILERAKQLDIKAAAAVKKTSKKLQLFLYSMKVGVAVAFSMLILALLPAAWQVDFDRTKQQPEENFWMESGLDWMNRTANGMTDRMNDFANLLLNGGK